MNARLTGPGPNPSGLCMCGCGGKAPLATKGNRKLGWVKGMPVRYIHHHRMRAAPFWERLPEMAAVSSAWERLVGKWDELIALMDLEAPGWDTGKPGRAPRTYALMRMV